MKNDYENMPELTKEQLALFKRISPEQHKKLRAGESVHILKNEEIVEVKKIGRPKKDLDEKENVVAIRLSKIFIERLKKKAGNIGWQTYAKQILEEHLTE